MHRHLTLFVVVLALLGLAAAAAAQNRTPTGNVPVVVVPARAIDSMDGAALYEAYCASRHGKDLKGLGVAGRFTRTQPTDLTKSFDAQIRRRICALRTQC